MFIDPQSATAGGGAALALVLYAAGSMFVTGPLVVARSVEKSGWVLRCEKSVQDEVQSRAGTSAQPPTIMSCDAILGSMDPRVRELMGEIWCRCCLRGDGLKTPTRKARAASPSQTVSIGTKPGRITLRLCCFPCHGEQTHRDWPLCGIGPSDHTKFHCQFERSLEGGSARSCLQGADGSVGVTRMIIGFVRIENGAVNTHRDSYLLENLSVVSVRRPFLIATLIFASGTLAFSIGF